MGEPGGRVSIDVEDRTSGMLRDRFPEMGIHASVASEGVWDLQHGKRKRKHGV